MGHGDANTLVHIALESDGRAAGGRQVVDAVLDEIYAGPKAAFARSTTRIMRQSQKLGESEVAPKKGYVSLRRKNSLRCRTGHQHAIEVASNEGRARHRPPAGTARGADV